MAGFGLGTPEYMSPEQAFGEPDIDGRSDTYSLACVAFELLAGNPPFSGKNATAVIMRKTSTDAPALTTQSRLNLPPAVDAVVSRALMRDRDQRPATVSGRRRSRNSRAPFAKPRQETSSRSPGRASRANVCRRPSPSSRS
jgi:serine/threonine-protein kinase